MVKVKELEELKVKVAEMLNREEATVGDVLRVLAIHHGAAWRSELLIDLAKFYRFQAHRHEVDASSVDSAIRRLKELGLLTVEVRRRGSVTTSQTYVETLIRLHDTEAIRTVLLSDHAFARYWYHRQQTIQDKLSRGLGKPKS